MRFLLIVLTICTLAFVPAAAQEIDFEQFVQVAQNNGMTLSEAVDSVRKSTNGKIISAQTKTKNGREVHYIKVLTKDGKVKTHTVPGRNRDNG